MNFEKICMMFSMQEPFYGIILSSMERVEDKTISTIAVGRFGNVFKLYYNPDFVGKFNTDTVLELLKHEVLHLALNHFDTMVDKEDAGIPHSLCNSAIDLEANCYINRSKMQKEVGGLWCEDFGYEKELGSRTYLDLLIDKANQLQQANANQPQQPCNGGNGGNQNGQNNQNGQLKQDNNDANQGSQNAGEEGIDQQDGMGGGERSGMDGQNNSGNDGGKNALEELADSLPEAFDDHSRWPKSANDVERESLQQVIDSMLDFAAEEVEKKCGKIPGEIAGRIEKIRKKPKPVTDWKRFFRRYIGNEFSELIRKSKKRESRRFPDAAGNRHQRKSHILVAIDTSGSVSMPEYREFMGQILTLKEKATFHIVECDAYIQHEYDFNGRINETLHGGGGTNFQPVIDVFNKNRKRYDALVYFTDGECDIPKDTPKETLWVISSRGDHDRKKYTVNGASSVFIKPRNN